MFLIVNLVRFPIFTNSKKVRFPMFFIVNLVRFSYIYKPRKGAFSITKKADLLKACSDLLTHIDISPKIALQH